MYQKIDANDLQTGMFVADLDRPWIDTPFLLQGFLLEDDEQLKQLRSHCEWVMIDPLRSVGVAFESPTAKKAFVPRAPGMASQLTAKPSPPPSPPPQTVSNDRSGHKEKSNPIRDGRPRDAAVAGRGKMAPPAAARTTEARREPDESAGNGLRSLWGNLRGGVTSLFGRADSDKLKFDKVPDVEAAPEQAVRPSFIPKSVQLITYEDKTTVEV